MVIRNVRNNVVDVRNADYVDFGRSKGLSGWVISTGYVLRNALIPTATLLSMRIIGMLSGSVIIENIFGLPGIGALLVQAVAGRDYAVVQACVLVFVIITLVVNLLTDILYSVLDHRIKLGGERGMSADTAVVKGSVKPAKSKSRRVPIWRRSPSLVVGAVIVLFTCMVAAFPSLFTSQDPLAINPSQMLQAPSAAHLFGTDNFGYDVFTRVVYATRLDLLIGVASAGLPFIVGSLLGLVAGYYGGKLDAIVDAQSSTCSSPSPSWSWPSPSSPSWATAFRTCIHCDVDRELAALHAPRARRGARGRRTPSTCRPPRRSATATSPSCSATSCPTSSAAPSCTWPPTS